MPSWRIYSWLLLASLYTENIDKSANVSEDKRLIGLTIFINVLKLMKLLKHIVITESEYS